MLYKRYFIAVLSTRRATGNPMTEKNELIWGLHIIFLQGLEVILKAKLKFFTVINWRFFQFYNFFEKKRSNFFISDAILTMIDCSNLSGNCLNQFSIPKSMGLDT